MFVIYGANFGDTFEVWFEGDRFGRGYCPYHPIGPTASIWFVPGTLTGEDD
jgi:hypothetical protein